jgi:hypothetical protein
MLGLFQILERDYHYSAKDLLSMSRFEFETMIDSLDLDTKKLDEKDVPAMTIDQAFPQFFTDPNVGRRDK